MVSEIEQLDMKRRKIMIGSLIGFTAWQLPLLFQYFNFNPIVSGWSSMISAIGCFVWLYYNVRLVQFSRLLRKKRELAGPLNDEYIQAIRIKSFTAAFWVLLACIVTLFVLSLFVDLKAQFTLHILIIVGVTAALVSYLIFDKE
ncbi:hypothetical protein [Cohnella mopanensis]|uniref:hypothetical protein n=1 Tax=Cohnella mopanensis TaxID=2911966 RepID=UPI001EF8DD27|nr:hypothetical protein [Cohnella mopanensis]